MLLRVNSLNVHYEKVQALTDISLKMGRGAIVTLLGANGAGKTTLMRTISGLKRVTTGEIWFGSERIDQMPPEGIVRLGVGHVPEGRRVFPRMTVLENLRVGAFSRKDSAEIVKDIEKILERFPMLKQRKRQSAGTLSGGEQQILSVGRALMNRPSLLLLDEPTLGLAPVIVEEVSLIIKEINQQGIGIVLVEQNAFMALDVAVWGYVMETGRIVMADSTKTLAQADLVKTAYLGG